ncbi:carbohydrate kinase family protein [Candidatus Saccharibacteria bacterium]|nr:carbohydrate kinase family protein [Candidatus Saccharibacteria bacterium]
MARIVSLGSALQDIYLVDRDDFVASTIGGSSIFGKIEIGTKVDIDKISYEVGGGGTNSAVTFARTGHDAFFIGNISHDPVGEAILAALDHEDVNTSYVGFSRRGTGLSIILLDMKSGERTILTHRGASAKFSNFDPKILSDIDPDWLYISTLRGDLDTLEKFLTYAKAFDIKVMLNPGLLELESLDRLLPLLSNIDILLVNKSEAAKIVPGKILTELLAHLANYCETVLITDSASGGIATNHAETYRFGVYEDIKVKDTTGAGDAFGSGFLAALANGKSFKDSLIFASANSTSVVVNLGAKRGILNGLGKLHLMPIQKVDL